MQGKTQRVLSRNKPSDSPNPIDSPSRPHSMSASQKPHVAKASRSRKENKKRSRRSRRSRSLLVQNLEDRQLMAANVMDDVIDSTELSSVNSEGLNVLINDSTGNEAQTVSAFNAEVDLTTLPDLAPVNDSDWFIPMRQDPNDPSKEIPQRSIFEGAVLFNDEREDVSNGGANNGDIDLLRDDDADFTNDHLLTNGNRLNPTTPGDRLDASEGMVIATLRSNDPVDASNVNLGVPQYASEGGGETWIAIAAGPENNGELSIDTSAAFFPYDAGWVGATFNGSASFTTGAKDADGNGILSATGSGGVYQVTVPGVNDSFSDGFLFGMGADNEDNYTRTRPIGDNQWAVQHRDNAAEIGGSEGDDFNVLYIPRTTRGLIGGVVDGDSTDTNSMLDEFGDFTLLPQGDGLYKLTVPGHDITSGVLIMENYDLTVTQPRNTYFTYDADPNDPSSILIRQFAWNGNTEERLDTDFVFFFIPFENNLGVTSDLEVTSLGATTDAPGALGGLSDGGVPVSVYADGSINYDFDLAALVEGDVHTDTFVYEASDPATMESAIGTVSVTLRGTNDAPIAIGELADRDINEDETEVIDLAAIFDDLDNGDSLTYSFNPGIGGLFSGEVVGDTLTVTPTPDAFGSTIVSVTATDSTGLTLTLSASFNLVPVDNDDVVAVDDAAVTDNVTPLDIAILANDYHPDTTPFSVAAAHIGGNPEATGNGDTVWTVDATTTAPNDLTIQSPANRGDVAVGRGGSDLSLTDGVFLGTVRDNTDPFQTVNAYAAFSSYGFATDTGVGGGERNSPLHAAFFPFAEGWTSGHVGSDGTLLGGVGVSQANVTKLGTGLFEISIPGVTNASFDGMLFAIGGNNDDNIVSVMPSAFGNTWQIRQMDSDSDIDGFEDDAFSFVYIPASTAGLIGGRTQEQEGFVSLVQSFGGASLDFSSQSGDYLVNIPGYTPNDGALIAVSSGSVFSSIGGVPTQVPANHQTVAVADGNSFRIQLKQSGNYAIPLTVEGVETPDVQFIFLPFDQPLERVENLDFSMTSFDTTSALGGTITAGPDGSLQYDPSTGNASITGLGNGEFVEDTFTYTVTDGRGGTSTATVTVTVQGPNRDPDAVDDTVNLNEENSKGAVLTVLGNDTDPDVIDLRGPIQGVAAGNLSVDESSVWSVAQTSATTNAITLGAGATGEVEVQVDGGAIAPASGITLATIRENHDDAGPNASLVQAFANGSGGTSLAIEAFASDTSTDADVSVAYFPFADGWVGGHVDAGGVLTSGNGLVATDIVRTGDGRYEVTIPGVTDSSIDGFLFVIGNEDSDNAVSSRAISGSGMYEVAVRDNQQDFGDGEDGGFSFLFVPRNAENLVAGTVDAGSGLANPVSLAIGDFTLERQDVTDGGQQWKLTIPGQSPDTGMLVLANQDNNELEDNYLSYESDGSGSFLIRNHDMPGLGRQSQPFTFMFVPFDGTAKPVSRPVTGPLSIQSVDATSALGASVTINADGTLLYQPGTLFDDLYSDESVVDTFSYTTTDGFGGSDTATVTVNINGFGEAPEIDLGTGPAYFGIGDSPVGIAPFADLVEIDDANVDGAVITVEITGGGVATDALAIRNEGTGLGQFGVSGGDITYEGTMIGSFTGGDGTNPLVITLNASANGAITERLLQTITFNNTDSEILPGTREVTFGLVDGGGRTKEPATGQVTLGYLRSRDFQQGVDYGFGTYTAAADAQIREADADSVIDPAADFLIDFDTSGNTSQAVLKFEDIFGDGPGQIPLGSIITSATLIVETNPNTTNAPGDGGRFFRMLQDWDDTTATWNSFGNDGLVNQAIDGGGVPDGIEARTEFESQVGTASGSGDSGTGILTTSVLPDVRAWAAGEANYGWAILGWDGRTDGWFFSSSEDETPLARPRLSIEWLPADAVDVASFQDGVDGYEGTVDTEIDSNGADSDLSAATTLFIDSPSSGALIRFDDIIGEAVGQIPAGSQIISARLRTASTTSNAQGDGGRFYPMLTTWSDTDTYNTLVDGVSTDGTEASDVFNTQAGFESRNPNVQGGFHDWDVTTDVQAWVNGTTDNNGWFINHWESGTDGWGFQSSEASEITERPRLEIYYTDAPAGTAPQVGDVVIADGTDQRSMVSEVTVSFDQDVNVQPGAFELEKLGDGGGMVDVTASDAVFNAATSQWEVILTFGGSLVEANATNSLTDGNYRLTINRELITGVTGGMSMADDRVDDFFRQYGDVDGQPGVGIGDFAQFRALFGTLPSAENYDPNLDFDGGGIGISDFAQFRSRFGTIV
ncbi:DNRLRE domain-containing protein [Crateriforma conspicua]|uniref:DNRLRE domain-containing protein n=1 Tax=Crateriforma conspicua TaxID=2527996 RepID=UPI0011A31071|nr:DNRLRE domain-containing protein [Crateriforma conspicua]